MTYKESIDPLVSKMIEKLLDREGEKISWEYCTISKLLGFLEQEVRELEVAFEQCNPRDVAREAVDVANYAMMIFDNANRVLESYND